MKQAIGTTFLLNIIIVFLVVTFAFLAATLSYMKSFKVNSQIANMIEKYEGYNRLSIKEIDRILGGLGYRKNNGKTCPRKSGKLVTSSTTPYRYCVYEQNKKGNYLTYKIVTYINLEIPILNTMLQIPITSQTEKMYQFS